MKKNKVIYVLILLGVAGILRLGIRQFLDSHDPVIQIIASLGILGVGAFFILRGAAEIIEETTEVLSERTKLAGGVLQSLGTAFPDMILGIVAALVSLRLRSTDYQLAINYAIIAAATTFGSNIYNIAHATWCMVRQNAANSTQKALQMVPRIPALGKVTPFSHHQTIPSVKELDTAIEILTTLTVITAVTAISMVLFGKVTSDLYQLIQPIGLIIFLMCIVIIYRFRKSKRQDIPVPDIEVGEKYYKTKSNPIIFAHLLVSGITILFAAETMVHAVEVLSHATGLPYVVAGVFAGLIGCLGEIIVIHNYTVSPKGRIGDALVGVGMDNIVTTAGAAIVAMMGGIFLGGSALILIFILIVTINTVLIQQINSLKNHIR